MKNPPLREFTFRVTIRLKQNPTKQTTDEAWLDGGWTAAGTATVAAAKAHIKEAVQTWGGQAPPDYPFWPSNMKTTVTEIK